MYDIVACKAHNNRIVFLTDDRENVIPILEKYFNISKYKSFLRQLQAYGFQRALPNPKDDPCHDTKPKRDSYRGKWSHKLFRRDKMNLCNKMTRDGKAKTDKDRADLKPKILNKKVVIARSKDDGFRSPLSPSAQLRHAPPPPNYLERIQQSKAAAAIAQQEQHQKELAVMQLQQKQHQQQQHQQHQQQQQLQILRNRILQQQQQQHAPHAPPPGVYHHDPRYSQHHPSQVPFQHPQHHLVQQYHAQQHPPRQGSPGQPGAPMPGGAPALLMARVKQQQEEQQRQQLQMHIHHLEQQQLLSKILAARGEAPPPPGKAPPSLSIPPAAAGAPAQAAQTLLAGINYNTNKQPSPSSPQLTAANKGVARTPSTKNSATDAVSEATSELHRAELALVERRKRLIEAQEQAQKEAEALAKAEAAVREHSTMARGGGGQPSSSVAATQELLMRHHAQSESAKPPLVPSSENPSSRLASNETTGARNRLMGGLPLTSLLEDIDNAFKSSPPPPQLQRDHSGGSKTIVTSNNNQHKITEEEMLRARSQSSAAPSQMEHLVHRQPTSNANNNNVGAHAPGASSPGPSASERDVIMARINAMEQIRMREQNQRQQQHQQQQQQQAQARHNQHQQQQQQQQQGYLLKIAMAKREEHEKRSRMGRAAVNGVTSPPQNDASVRNAVRNAAVGLIGGTNTNGGSGKPMNSLPPGSKNSPPAKSGGGLSKEMMEIFAQTAAAAMNFKTNIDSNSASGGSGSNSEAASPPTIVPSSHSLRPPNNPSATNSGDILPPAPTSGNAGALHNGITGRAQLKPPSAAPINQPVQPSFGITNSELEAARALMKIPGAVSQSTGEPIKGHWELVKPEELKKGAALVKALPETVTKSADLSYETYKSMAMKLTPPNVMRIPDGWDSLKEPVYLVVDPANVASTSGAMATTAGGAPRIPSAAQGAPERR